MISGVIFSQTGLLRNQGIKMLRPIKLFFSELFGFIGRHSLIAGLLCILIFSYVNKHVWGDDGSLIHLNFIFFQLESNAYWLVWAWIAMLMALFSFNCLSKEANPIWPVVYVWWLANIGMTTILNAIYYRGIEQSGGMFEIVVFNNLYEFPVILLDFVGQGAVDILAAVVVLILVLKNRLAATLPLIVFMIFLFANMFGHLSGTNALKSGMNIESVAQLYEPYMWLIFTVMLLLLSIGSGIDAALRKLSKHELYIYRDLKPVISRYIAGIVHSSRNRDKVS